MEITGRQAPEAGNNGLPFKVIYVMLSALGKPGGCVSTKPCAWADLLWSAATSAADPTSSIGAKLETFFQSQTYRRLPAL